MLEHKKIKGFSIIELMIGIAVLGILIAAGVPSLRTWIQSSQIRTSAESIQSGLELARAEAVRRNVLVRFQLVSGIEAGCGLSTSKTSWVVSLDEPSGKCTVAASDSVDPRIIQVRSGSEGSSNVVANATQSTIFFNGLGRQVTSLISAGVASPAPTQQVTIQLTNPNGGACVTEGGKIRCLNVTVTPGGKIRMCDPAFDGLVPADPQACV